MRNLTRGFWVFLVGWFPAACGSAPTVDDLALEEYNTANQLFEREEFEGCVEKYEYVLRYRDRIHDAYLKLATCHERLGQPDRAIEILTRSLRIDRSHPEVLWRLAELHEQKGAIEAALEMNGRLLERNPADPKALEQRERLMRRK